MPRRFTLAILVLRAQQRCDMENQGLISSDEWKAILSTAYAELYSIVAETGLRYFETRATLTTPAVDGLDGFPEPTDHLSTVGVFHVSSAGDRTPLFESMAQERHGFPAARGERSRGYAFIDDRLMLYPPPPDGQTYELLYVPQPPDLAGYLDTDLVDVVTPDGEAFLIWSAAVQALAKEESDTSLARAEREAARERVYNWAVLRAMHSSRRVMVDGSPYGYEEGDWRY